MRYYKVDKLLEEMAIEGRNHFSPHYVCRRLGIENIKEVADYLLSLVNKGILIPIFDVECPEGDSDFSVNNPSCIISEPRICHHCGIEYIPDPERIWLNFNFTDEYSEFVKKREPKKYTNHYATSISS